MGQASEPSAETAASKHERSTRFKLLLLAALVIQYSSVVLIVRHTRASTTEDDMYVVNDLILCTETLKLILAFALEIYVSDGILQSIDTHILSNPRDFFKITIPALLYLFQNSVLYVGMLNLSAPLFQVTYQGKTLTTAIVSVFFLARRYTWQQWFCLSCLGMGVAIVVLAENNNDDDDDDDSTTASASKQNLVLGLSAVTTACFSSAIASVYFEKVIKDTTAKTPAPSLWMRNIQLAFFSVIIALTKSRLSVESKPFLHGFTGWVWAVVMLQAAGGLLVAAVMKYADNVLKGLATAVSVVVSTAFSVVLFGTKLTGSFFMGGALILSSVYVFSNPVKICVAEVAKDEEKGEVEVLVLKE